MTLSLIIVNYNVREFLENCLRSVESALEGIEAEIFVVDNASSDESVAMVREKFPDVHLIASQENLGFARGNNLALREARGEFLLLLNPDTITREDTFRKMIDFFHSHPDAGMAGCKILNADGTLQLPCRRSIPTPWVAFTKIFGLAGLFPHSPLFARYNLTFLPEDETYEVEALMGAFMMVRRRTYETIGGLDEDFFMYGEDLDWCYRARIAGEKIYYVHDVQIVHYKGESTRRSSMNEVKVFYDAMHIFARKHFGASGLWLALLRMGISLRALVAYLVKHRAKIVMMVSDVVLVFASIHFAWAMRFTRPMPPDEFWQTQAVPALVFLFSFLSLGVYTTKWNSLKRTFGAVIVSFFIISSLTYFFKEYAYSRQVVLVMTITFGIASLAMRSVVRSFGRLRRGAERRTIIVGTGTEAEEVARRLRSPRRGQPYTVVGFIAKNIDRIGNAYAGGTILGAIETIGKEVDAHDITDVIVADASLAFMDLLDVFTRLKGRSVTVRLVPSKLDVLIAKASVDSLTEEIPMVDLEYNIRTPLNRFVKRTFDILISSVGLLAAAPALYLLQQKKGDRPSFSRFFEVFRGKKSIVGIATTDSPTTKKLLGFEREGLVSLAGVSLEGKATPEEIDEYNVFYARNYSPTFDLEILWKYCTRRERV